MPRRNTKRRARARKAFTLIEIVAALGVMTVASMAIITLQGHTMRANMHARQLAIALQIAQSWLERFKQDAHGWTAASDPADNDPAPATVLGNRLYLDEVLADEAEFQQIPNAMVLDGAEARTSNGYDYQGNPINWTVAGEANLLHYCVSFRPTWVIEGRSIRTDVRVWWPRESTSEAAAVRSTMAAYIANRCDDDDEALSPGGEANPNFHFAYLSTVIGVTGVPR
jgi:Tfp pilus assembly protein PilV